MNKKQTLGNKILLAMLSSVILMGLVSGLVFSYSIRRISNRVRDITEEMGNTTSDVSSSYMAQEIVSSMQELARDKANIADGMFQSFKRSIEIVASTAEEIYRNPSQYRSRSVGVPMLQNNGTLSLQVLYDSECDPDSVALKEELGLMGNIGDVILAVNDNHASIASVYLASEAGFTVQADYISASKYDENGKLMPLEAKQRPWYIGAKETGKTFMTGVVRDVHTPRLGIMCGVPVYRGNEFVGVAGGGMYLDEIGNIVKSVNLGENCNACLINGEGTVLFSTRETGSLVPDSDQSEIYEDLSRIIENVNSNTGGVTLMNIDGTECYVSYAPLKTVNWILLLIMPQEIVEASNNQLQDVLKSLQSQVYENTNNMMRDTVVIIFAFMMIVLFIALINSYRLSNHIVRPINKLTEEVGKIQGDNLDFKWDMDTGDETAILAESFQSLTERMKKYIVDIQKITSERERIGTELALAEKIQYSALPHLFPPFPERKEFELYASLNQAREVGGDFYDFFMIDDDHLALVIADVSGKGIPGALFMMTSMVMIRNNTMSGAPVEKILQKTNLGICRSNTEDMFITVWIGILEISTGIMTCSNAGHEYPMLKKPDGKFELYKDKHGLVIGAMEDVKYTSYQIKLAPGTKLFVYTDGVPEATNSKGELFGTERALKALNSDPDCHPQALLENVDKAVDEFVGEAEQFDDLTMLCIEYKGPQKEI